jgi:hypothetical protein
VENPSTTPIKEHTGKEQCQKHDHHFLWHQEDCTQIICPNMPNCEIQVLLRHFAATSWRLAMTSPQTLVGTDLTASPWQRSFSNFGYHTQFLAKHPPYSPHLAPCDFFLFPKMKLKLKGCRLIPIRRFGLNRRQC